MSVIHAIFHYQSLIFLQKHHFYNIQIGFLEEFSWILCGIYAAQRQLCVSWVLNSDKRLKIVLAASIWRWLQDCNVIKAYKDYTVTHTPLLMNECLFLWHTWALSVMRQCVILQECAKNTHSITNTPPQRTSCWTMTNNIHISLLIHTISNTSETLVYLKR